MKLGCWKRQALGGAKQMSPPVSHENNTASSSGNGKRVGMGVGSAPDEPEGRTGYGKGTMPFDELKG